MEPTEAKVRYVIHATVRGIIRKSRQEYVAGVGKDAVFNSIPIGWFLHLNGSHEAINLGTEKPNLEAGDQVKITLEKV